MTYPPDFPEFVPLHLADQSTIEALTAGLPPYSDFNFVSLWTWDTDGAVRWSTLHGNLVVQFADYSDGSPFLSFLGLKRVDDTVAALLDHARESALVPELRLVGECVVRQLDPHRWRSSEDLDNHDYVLDTLGLAKLRGGEWKSVRSQLNRFWRQVPDCEARALDLSDDITRQAVFGLADGWLRTPRFDDPTPERRAITRAVMHATELAVSAAGLLVNNELVAFCINENLGNGWAMCHFTKSSHAYANSSLAMDQWESEALLEAGVSRMNYEQDLGVPGLRERKQASHPVEMLRKYTVRCS